MTADRSLRERVARIVDPEAWERAEIINRYRPELAELGDQTAKSLSKADAILSELTTEGSVKAGGEWRWVPVEPTEEMLDAGIAQARDCTDEWRASSACIAEHIYAAMLTASPGLGGQEDQGAACAMSADAPAFGAAEDTQRKSERGGA